MPAIASRGRLCLGAALFLALGSGPAAFAQSGGTYFLSNNLLLSRVVYDNKRSNVVVGMQLPPGCAPAHCVSAITDGTYPYVWNNAQVDGSFGITAKIILDQLTPSGIPINSLEVPNSSRKGVPSTADQMVTSFSSKSELALNLSTDGQSVSFMGYLAPVNALDVSNSNTPGVVDPTNPVPGLNYRVVAQINAKGKLHFTATNAYSGNNGRAAILNADDGVLYAAGNAGNGSNPQPNGVILGAGAQILTPEVNLLVAQSPGLPTPVGSFNITELGDKPDKIGKDTNFRGLSIFDNVIYYTKGSGGNGVNTVYFLDTTGKACPDGVGLPAAGAQLPTTGLSYDLSTLQETGLPSNMCILKGFNTELAKTSTNSFPFGLFFANPATLYVADGTIWAITSTVSGSSDQGADPNKLVTITDPLSATSPVAGESFRTIRAAGFGEVLRGVSFTPGSR